MFCPVLLQRQACGAAFLEHLFGAFLGFRKLVVVPYKVR
jgi:hypothetical protein